MNLSEMNRTFRVVGTEYLVPFRCQPFRVPDGEEMNELVRSVAEKGVCQPVIVRQQEGGRYEILSGLARWMACRRAGVRDIPCMILDVSDDDEAAEIMVDMNLAAGNGMLMSEKAKAYEIRKRATEHKGKHGNEDGCENELMLFPECCSGCMEAEKYIRLNRIIPELMDEIDMRGRGYLQAAVDISYLDEDCQRTVAEVLHDTGRLPDSAGAWYLRKICEAGNPGRDVIRSVIESGREPELIVFSRSEPDRFLPGKNEKPGSVKKRINKKTGKDMKHRKVS